MVSNESDTSDILGDIDNKYQYDKLYQPELHTISSYKLFDSKCKSESYRADVLSSFKKIKELGSGGQGVVSLYTSNQNEQLRFVVKQINITDYKIKSCYYEFSAMLKLNHPNVVQMYDMIVDNLELYFVLEYCPGGDLFHYITKDRLNHDEIRHVMTKLIQAVRYCHDNKILHRDLKPENVIYDRVTKKVKLIDFGWSHPIEWNESVTESCGTYDYITPEMVTKCVYYYKSASWTIGVMLYELFCGSTPFDHPNILRLKLNIKYVNYVMSDQIPLPLQDLIRDHLLIENFPNRNSLTQILDHGWFRNP